jgi:hypothetical protein
MKLIIIIFFLLTGSNLVFAQHEHAAPVKVDTGKIVKKPSSPKMIAMAQVGENHVHIDYGSPSVRGRVIWNGLVAYDKVWSSGAHKATWIEFSKDIRINGVSIPKGKYGFFTIPNEKMWTLILSKTWDMHLADEYKQENDLIRLTVKPHKNKDLTEALSYEVKPMNDKKGSVILTWEYISVSFDFKNN